MGHDRTRGNLMNSGAGLVTERCTTLVPGRRANVTQKKDTLFCSFSNLTSVFSRDNYANEIVCHIGPKIADR